MSLAETQHFCPWTGKVGKHALPIRASASMCFPNLLVAFCSLFTNSTHTHALISCKATSTGIPDPFFPPIKLMCTLTHSSQSFLPPLFCDYTERPGSIRQRWDAHRSTTSEQKLRELWQPPRNPGEKAFRDVPHSLPCLSWIQALCAAKRDGHCYRTNMHTFMHQRKYFTLASCSPHDYSTRFPPLAHNHNEPHWLFD